MNEITIGKYKIGRNNPPFLIAEISANHNGSIEEALELVDKAKECGVQAVKLQTYTPDTITLNIKVREFLINDPNSLWKGRNLHDLYTEAHTPWDWHDAIFSRCQEWGLIGFSTPFDETAVDFLEKFDVPCYKIGSPEIVDIPLLKYAASKGKPMIISTGGASETEISEALEAVRSSGCSQIVLLKCTMEYPAKAEDMNLLTIPDMEKKFGVPIGLSDHTLGVGVAIASIPLGACVIEKHITMVRDAANGVDSAFSTEPEEFKELAEQSLNAWKALGSVHYGPLPGEKVSYSHRPSIYFVKDAPAGTVITAEYVRTLRPGMGLPPKEMDRVIGSTLTKDVKRGTAATWDVLSG